MFVPAFTQFSFIIIDNFLKSFSYCLSMHIAVTQIVHKVPIKTIKIASFSPVFSNVILVNVFVIPLLITTSSAFYFGILKL